QVLGFAATSTEVFGPLLEDCPSFPVTRCYTRLKLDRSDVLWGGRLTFDRRFGSALLGYASIARGFKGAGISPISREPAVGVSNMVDPETVVTFELGGKSEWRDHTLRINGAAFFNDWSNYQESLNVSTPPPGFASVLTNLPAAQTWGGELEVD